MRSALAFATGLFLALSAWGEIPEPRVSPSAAVRQQVGTTEVEIVYSRPAVKGRAIWGGLVHYGEVWRLGANEATTIRFTDPVKLAGHEVPAGTYGLFAIPDRDRWTLVLSRNAEQWGAFSYKPEEDLLRFDVKPEGGPATEWMTFALTPADANRTTVEFAWEKLRFSFPLEVDPEKIAWSHYDAALADPKAGGADYRAAANYALQQGKRLDEALGWVDKATLLDPSYRNYELKARLLHAKGRTAEALPLLDQALVLSQGKTLIDYQQRLEKTKKEWEGESPHG